MAMSLQTPVNLDGTGQPEVIICAVLGDRGVGKSTLISMWTGQSSEPLSCPFGVVKRLPIAMQWTAISPKENAIVKFVEVLGNEAAIAGAVQRASAVIMMYDVGSKASMNQLLKWWPDVKKHAHDYAFIGLIGNKDDPKCKKKVTTDDARKICRNLEIQHFQENTCHHDRYRTGIVLCRYFVQLALRHHRSITSQEPYHHLPFVEFLPTAVVTPKPAAFGGKKGS